MPIEFTSEETKRSHKTEERMQYLRYLFLAVIGSFAFLFFSFGYLPFLLPIAVSAAIIVFLEYKRSLLKKRTPLNAPERVESKKQEPAPALLRSFETSSVVAPERKSTKPGDILIIVAPACLACAVIAIAAYQSFQQQLNIGLGNSSFASFELSIAVLFTVACLALLIYVLVLIRQRQKRK